jgi:hypothetical protein
MNKKIILDTIIQLKKRSPQRRRKLKHLTHDQAKKLKKPKLVRRED